MVAGPEITSADPAHRTGSYRAWELAGDGSGIIDLAWHSRVDHGHPEAHRLLPHSEPSLAIRRWFDRDGATTGFRLEITCVRPDGGHYCPEPGEELFGLRLAPEWSETGLGLRVQEYFSHDTELEPAIAQQFELARRLADAGDFVAAWQALLMKAQQLADGRKTDRVGHAASLARKAGGRLTPAELAELADISPRHLRRGFVERFGLSPRGWVRRLRLTAALLEAEQQNRPDWAGIAAGHRFSDQAHLIRECRAILGESPGEIHAYRRSMAVSFNT